MQIEVNYIIHCAANIALEAHMRSCLLVNYKVCKCSASRDVASCRIKCCLQHNLRKFLDLQPI